MPTTTYCDLDIVFHLYVYSKDLFTSLSTQRNPLTAPLTVNSAFIRLCNPLSGDCKLLLVCGRDRLVVLYCLHSSDHLKIFATRVLMPQIISTLSVSTVSLCYLVFFTTRGRLRVF